MSIASTLVLQLRSRIDELRSDSQRLLDLVVPKMDTAERERSTNAINEAARYISAADKALLALVEDPNSVFSVDSRGGAFELLIRAQVEIDLVRRLRAGSEEGWVEMREFDEDSMLRDTIVIDTQLARYYLDRARGGLMFQCDYKARKRNLCNVYPIGNRASLETGAAFNHSFTPLSEFIVSGVSFDGRDEWTEAEVSRLGACEFSVMQQAATALSLRFVNTLSHPHATPYHCSKTMGFDAIAPGRSAESKTGLSVNYWLDGDNAPSAELFFAVDVCLVLPGRGVDDGFATPLLADNAPADNSVGLAEQAYLTATQQDGNLHGMRLTDGGNDRAVDISTSRAIAAIQIKPHYGRLGTDAERMYFGSTYRLFIPAAEIYGEENSLNVFISIF